MCDTAVPHLSGIRSAGIGPPRRRGHGADATRMRYNRGKTRHEPAPPH